MQISREIDKIICSCGGEPVEVERTAEEISKYGCSRDKGVLFLDPYPCCVRAIQCPKCGTRWTLDLLAPDMDDF